MTSSSSAGDGRSLPRSPRWSRTSDLNSGSLVATLPGALRVIASLLGLVGPVSVQTCCDCVRKQSSNRNGGGGIVVVGWLLNVPATGQCISGTDLLNFMRCHTEIEVAQQTFHLTPSQYTDTGPTSPSNDRLTPGAWQGSHWSANFEVTGMIRPRKIPAQTGFEPGIFRSGGGRLKRGGLCVIASLLRLVGPVSVQACCDCVRNQGSNRKDEGGQCPYTKQKPQRLL